MNADGSSVRRLTYAGENHGPDWSPDGRRIVFSSVRGGNGEIVVMNADGSDPRNLTNHQANDMGPAWRPIVASTSVGVTPIAALEAILPAVSPPQRPRPEAKRDVQVSGYTDQGRPKSR